MTLSYSLATSTRYLLSQDFAKLRSDSKFIVFRLWHVIRSFVADPSTIRLRVLDARLTSSYIPIECGSTTTSDFPPSVSQARWKIVAKLSEFMKTNSYAMKNIWNFSSIYFILALVRNSWKQIPTPWKIFENFSSICFILALVPSLSLAKV